jgi:hypothetical protein
MNVDVIVPFGGGCAHRSAALDFVLGRFDSTLPSWRVLVGRCDGPWSKAVAVADALDRSTADVIVVHDADVWSTGTAVAVAEGLSRASWAVPHRKVHRLTEAATGEVLSGVVPLHGERPAKVAPEARYERVHDGFLGGGIVALRRDLYDRVPLDRRFVGWGHEDESWAWALRLLAGKPWRGDDRLYHLWHPPQERVREGRGSAESWALRGRYRRAVLQSDRGAMLALLAESVLQ